jgi:hypothetical protein
MLRHFKLLLFYCFFFLLLQLFININEVDGLLLIAKVFITDVKEKLKIIGKKI